MRLAHERVWLRDLPHDPHYSRVRTATDAAYIFHSLQRLITTYVLFLDGANQAVALVPIPPTSKPRKEWLEREARRYGAETAIVGVQGDQAVDEMADHLEGIRMTNPAGSGIYSDVGGVVRDVINIDSRQPWADRKKGRRQLKLTMPMLESTLFQTPSTEVWALMEEGAEYDPETVKPEHGDWRKMREPRKLRSRRPRRGPAAAHSLHRSASLRRPKTRPDSRPSCSRTGFASSPRRRFRRVPRRSSPRRRRPRRSASYATRSPKLAGPTRSS